MWPKLCLLSLWVGQEILWCHSFTKSHNEIYAVKACLIAGFCNHWRLKATSVDHLPKWMTKLKKKELAMTRVSAVGSLVNWCQNTRVISAIIRLALLHDYLPHAYGSPRGQKCMCISMPPKVYSADVKGGGGQKERKEQMCCREGVGGLHSVWSDWGKWPLMLSLLVQWHWARAAYRVTQRCACVCAHLQAFRSCIVM